MKKLILLASVAGLLSSASVALAAGEAAFNRNVVMTNVMPLDGSTTKEMCNQLHDEFSIQIYKSEMDGKYYPEVEFDINENHAMKKYTKIDVQKINPKQYMMTFMGESTMVINGEDVTTSTFFTAITDNESNDMKGTIVNKYCKVDFVSTAEENVAMLSGDNANDQ